MVAFSDSTSGPVLQHWGPEPIRDWTPADGHGFETAADRLPSELTALGTRQTRGSDLIVDHGDGLVGARLVWSDDLAVSVEGSVHTLRARATDTTGHLSITLVIETSTEHDAVRKHAVIGNAGDRPLVLDRAFAPAWELPVGPGATVDLLGGHWAREFGEFRVPLPAGELSIGSRQGVTSHTYSPVLGISALEPSGADASSVAYGVALAWPGSWRMLVDAIPHRRRVRVAGGVDDESGRILLEPGEEYRTPDAVGIAAPDGSDGLRRRWHDLQRDQLSRDLSPAHRPVLYNSWYATTFDVRPEHQLAAGPPAAALGVEAFVVDDGWFADRDDDRHGLGNWWPDPVAFPDGLDPLISGVQDLGLRFGIWVEPEAVNPGAEVLQRASGLDLPGRRPPAGDQPEPVRAGPGPGRCAHLDQGLAAPAARRRADQLSQVGHEPPGQRRRPPGRPARPGLVGAACRGLSGDHADAAAGVSARDGGGLQRGWRPHRPGRPRGQRRGVAERRDRPA